MTSKFVYNVALASVLGISSLVAAQPEQRDCGGDYRYSNQAPAGAKHSDVQRAGVLLCKDFGKDDRVPDDRYSVILGHDKNLNVWLPSAGKVEKNHKYTTDTASAELCEETGGLIKYSAQQISQLPYVYAGNKQMFFLVDSANANIGVTAITKSCQQAQISNLPSCFKEIDRATAVSVVELLNVAQQIKSGALGRQNSYTLHMRSQGTAIEIDGYYMRIFATRYNEAKVIFSQLFNHQF